MERRPKKSFPTQAGMSVMISSRYFPETRVVAILALFKDLFPKMSFTAVLNKGSFFPQSHRRTSVIKTRRAVEVVSVCRGDA